MKSEHAGLPLHFMHGVSRTPSDRISPETPLAFLRPCFLAGVVLSHDEFDGVRAWVDITASYPGFRRSAWGAEDRQDCDDSRSCDGAGPVFHP